MQFVMRHAPGARALKFVRRLPLFKGLGDNNLISVASRMREKVYQVRQSAWLRCIPNSQSESKLFVPWVLSIDLVDIQSADHAPYVCGGHSLVL